MKTKRLNLTTKRHLVLITPENLYLLFKTRVRSRLKTKLNFLTNVFFGPKMDAIFVD